MSETELSLQEAAELTGIEVRVLTIWIEREWVRPPSPGPRLDHEDIARLRLIQNLIHDFGVNDESVPLILHLMDQLYHLRHRLRAATGADV